MLTSCSACAALIVGLPARCPHCDALVRRGAVSRASTLLALAVLTGCSGGAVALYGAPITDDDGDGYPVGDDCDDSDPDVNPAASEIPNNGIDDDCNGMIDDGVDG